jgi:heme/copper-type cytochrome/quinol oxidase subunit 3
MLLKKHHPYHLITHAAIPYLLAGSLFIFVLGWLIFFHTASKLLLLLGLVLTVYYIFQWSADVLSESLESNIHNKEIENQFVLGSLFFILSETMLFFGFFWAFFHTSLNPSIFLGNVFPPIGIESLNPAHWPLINTITLLLSGVFVNAFYYSLKAISPKVSFYLIRDQKNIKEINNLHLISTIKRMNSAIDLNTKFFNIHKYLILTLFLGTIFLLFQVHEYINHASFEFSDGIYGSVFYSLTGLHGLHVLAGVLFLGYSFFQIIEKHTGNSSKKKFGDSYYDLTVEPNVGITFSVLYFHYVDIVWLFLYIFIYLWGY